MYTTQEIVTLARSIADMANAKYITQEDEASFLNESYKSLYSRYTSTGNEYWLNETVIPLTSAMLTASGKGKEYLVILPTDFYQLRGLDWDNGSSWLPVQKNPWSQRDYVGGEPRYRMQNSKLLILSGITPTIRVYYYPVPASLEVNATEIAYPNTEMYEILAYSMAANFVRKQTDLAKLPVINEKLAELWGRFDQIMKQDQYQFERIQNDYKGFAQGW
jgi:hypothetical protein